MSTHTSLQHERYTHKTWESNKISSLRIPDYETIGKRFNKRAEMGINSLHAIPNEFVIEFNVDKPEGQYTGSISLGVGDTILVFEQIRHFLELHAQESA